jgi:RNA polymerase sigma factor (sigma-70 family)
VTSSASPRRSRRSGRSDEHFLSEEEERQAVRSFRALLTAQTDGAGDFWIQRLKDDAEKAIELLVRSHRPIVRRVVSRYRSNIRTTDDDLRQEGDLALVKAVHGYACQALSVNSRFAPYAYGRVRAAVGLAADLAGHPATVPQGLLRHARQAERVRRDLEANGSASREDLCWILGVTQAELLELERLNAPPLLLSTPIGDGTLTVGDTLYYRSERNSVSIEAEGPSAEAVLYRHVNNGRLTPEERAVVRLKFDIEAPDMTAEEDASPQVIARRLHISYDEAVTLRHRAIIRRQEIHINARADGDRTSFAAIGRFLGISESQVRALYRRALAKLRHIPELEDLAADPTKQVHATEADDGESWYLASDAATDASSYAMHHRAIVQPAR